MMLSFVRTPDELVARATDMRSFDCGFASRLRSKILAQDDNVCEIDGVRRNELDFQVNDQTYFVTVGDDVGDWEVFIATPDGARSIPVYKDEADLDAEDASILVEDKRRRKIVN